MKKFKKVHVELTNICDLKCDFCPPKTLENKTMSLAQFSALNKNLENHTYELAYHVVGDPLVLSNLADYLDISYESKLKVNITTAANNLQEKHFEILSHKTVKQINFSINSYNANSHKKTLEEYLKPIFEFCEYANKNENDFFINLRVWNLDRTQTAIEFNKKVFDLAKKYFTFELDLDELYEKRPKNIRISRKTFFNFDDYFEWPSLNNKFISKKGFCHGLDSHFAILANGDLAPCCLDKDAIINLGNVFESSVESILKSNRTQDIISSFKKGIVKEELCQKCSYRTRFDEKVKI